tara:strand:+ start:2034 stop:2273 length:240 start_codon:yes stop_codon:yes gene_type:complete
LNSKVLIISFIVILGLLIIVPLLIISTPFVLVGYIGYLIYDYKILFYELRPISPKKKKTFMEDILSDFKTMTNDNIKKN